MPSHQTLSFAITTSGPAARVRTLLEWVRPHVDEIVLAADRDGDPDVLDACADLADRRLRFELRDSPARLVGWIQHECSADWILRLDDDEVPSPALLRALPELMAERRLSEVVFHRRWLVDSVERWIDSPPWRTDYQGRLRRNVPGLWRFDGLVHTDGDVLGERRLVELPLYHCDLLLTSFERRWGKSLRYEAEAPGAVWDGFPLNATYLPERFEDLSTRAVPVEDRPSLQALVDSSERTAPSRTAGDGAAPVRELEFGEVDRFNSSARPTQVALRAALEWVHAPDSLPAGTVVHHDVRIRNLGDALWRPERGPSSIQVSLRCRDPANGKLVVEHLEPFTETVWPGQETVLLLPVRTPRDPGRYVLELALAFEHRRFGDGPRREVTVLPGTPASVNGNLDALAEAAGTARALSDIERRRDESQLAAARLRATRRYRVAHLLVRLARRRPREGAR